MKEKTSVKEKLAYALANFGNAPISTLMSSYLLIFYTNVVGLNPAACATLFLIARILDGLNDPIVGFIIDHLPSTKMGHFRPTLLIGSILCGLNFLLLWFGPLMAPGGKLAIAYVSYLLIGVLFPVMDISLNSLLPVMTENMEDRNTLSSIKGFVMTVAALSVSMIAPLMIVNASEASGYTKIVVIATILVIAFSVIGAIGVKERVVVEKEDRVNYKFLDLVRIITRKPVLVTFATALLYYTGTMIFMGVNAYYYTYVIGNLQLLSVASIVQIVATVVATIVAGKLMGKLGKKKLYVLGLIIFGILPLIRLIDATSVPILMLATAFFGFGGGLYSAVNYGIQADNTDYIELDMGYRAEAAVASLSSFITKCAMGVGGAIPGYILAAVGFQADAATQSPQVLSAITMCIAIVPAVFAILGVVLFSKFYPLTKEKLEEQNKKLEILHAQK
ncbi:MAG: MFS transporter [Blautia sp.]|nr:MFS transporter [Blautia sp.]